MSPSRICFVTLEFHGLFKNGGIGTATTSLALALASKGLDVTVVIPNADDSGPRLQTGDFESLKADYAKLGVKLDYVRPHPHIDGSLDEPRTISYCVFLYLQQARFDVVLFNDNGGQAYYSVLAKRTGVFENPPLLCIVAHGPLEWVNELNMTEYVGRGQIAVDYLERSSVRLADVLVSPSQYMLEWMASRDWVLPKRSEVLQNLVDVNGLEAKSAQSAGSVPIREIVFFGRMETRKGISLFCDALDLLDQTADLSSVRVTFLGKFHRIGSLHSGVYVAERGRHWKASLRILSGYDQNEALEYLRRPGKLAVIASSAENSPCVVAECLQLGLLFLATNSGGTAELIAPKNRCACLFAPEPAALAQRLGDVLRSGHNPAQLAVSRVNTLDRWVKLLGSGNAEYSVSSPKPPRVSVCLVWSDSSEFAACLAALARQSYSNIEFVVVAHPDSGAPGMFQLVREHVGVEEIPVHVCTGNLACRGSARDEAARLATGEYLLFVDEPIATLLPGAVEAFVTAADRTGADVLTALRAIGPNNQMPKLVDRQWVFPIGACVELGSLENCFGEGAFLIKSSCFAKTDGFDADCDNSSLDWIFLAKALLAGASLELIPSPIIELRERRLTISDGQLTVDSQRRVLHAYGKAPLSTVRRIFESLFDVHRVNQVKMRQALEGLAGPARELATRLSRLDPGAKDTARLFVEFCCERRMVDLALDFALNNDVAFLSETIGAARRATEEAVLDTVRARRLDLWHTIDLTEVLQARSSPFRIPGAGELLRLPGGSIMHPAPAGDCIVKVAGAVPPGTGSILVTCLAEGSGSALLAAVVQDSDLSPALNIDRLVAGGRAWSGWVAGADAGSATELSIVLPEPAASSSDLYLLTRNERSASGPAMTVTWQRLTVAVRIADSTTKNSIQRATPMSRIQDERLNLGEVLTEMSGVPIDIFKPGERTLLHPLPDRLALVRIPAALPPSTRGLRCAVSVEHAKAHPVDFGLWVRPVSAPAQSHSELLEDETFSGWLQVALPFKQHNLTFLLPAPNGAAMDIYLATRVAGFRDVNFCHAFWHEFWILE
jgi:O-antigen biosynthesis protein